MNIAFDPQLAMNSIDQISLATFILIYIGGVLTSISPCIISMMPVLVAYIGGYGEASKARGFVLALAFTVGLATTFSIFGLIAGTMGTIFGRVGDGWYYFMAVVAIAMGLNLMGFYQIKWPALNIVAPKKRGIGGAYLVGLFFGTVATACSTPILAVILAFVATNGQMADGAALLFVYGLGQGVPLLVVGTFTGLVKKLTALQKWGQWINIISGLILIVLGVYYLSLAVR
ncbi:cytochrome c biogenesis protein CcdA [Metallumcola ferriviriculae]|uniref:Cytochrome c biogenesis protein CcdA n=1 Tax=Metallumcola ferriviriculae TaxID=3039180 RepID=A0AAU0UKG5_9FIRM|nr:cytochrome c biogenesis protein CcdA [Desulfitibacteraceae bacterium MK1]